MSGAVAIDFKQVYSQTLSSIDIGKSLVPQLIGTFWYFQKRHLKFKFPKSQLSNYQKKKIYIYIFIYIYIYCKDTIFNDPRMGSYMKGALTIRFVESGLWKAGPWSLGDGLVGIFMEAHTKVSLACMAKLYTDVMIRSFSSELVRGASCPHRPSFL